MSENFGEELVYWYLRFNGFFTINNFVLHHSDNGRTSDADILAVRFPHVYEDIGGQETDWDEHLFNHFQYNKIIGLICEVKTGLNFNPNELFKQVNISKSLSRFGFIENLHTYSNELNNKSNISIQNYQIYKVLVSRKHEAPRNDCIHINLIDIQSFLRKRLKKYIGRKLNDRMFFQSSLLQYIIWDESLR